MQDSYVIRCGNRIAIASLDNAGGNWWVRRVNVPEKFRGHGVGSHLLKLVLEDADALGHELRLQVFSSGPLTDQQLTDWYGRYGFSALPLDDYTLVRPPQDH